MYALYSLRKNTLYANIFSPKYSAKWNSGLFFMQNKGWSCQQEVTVSNLFNDIWLQSLMV